ncbi:VOC family protein [Pseudochryseolinea flava]|uniref:VOC family protein n=1 Tax=Pseudochryseolinea flava TaxID=2059302 RepID=A0A364Y4N5_9BACT|nr:VOC family protein [Pseudochryseolinea flava]RAW00765.1 VOC family protein [Pseudochryseolinea flava]
MALINPYIHFNGNAEEAFTFYKSVFGGTFRKIMRYGDLSSPEHPIPDTDAKRIMHIALPIGQNTVLLGSDVMQVMGNVNENDNRNSIAITANSRDEADKLFTGLSKGGKIEMLLSDGPLGSYFGMFADQYGVQWMVNFDPKA